MYNFPGTKKDFHNRHIFEPYIKDLASGAAINLQNRKIVHKDLDKNIAKTENFFIKSSELKWNILDNPEENWTAVSYYTIFLNTIMFNHNSKN